jgi:hypothetical protein
MVAPPVITSAVENALQPFGVKISSLPMTREKIVNSVQQAQQACRCPQTAGMETAASLSRLN